MKKIRKRVLSTLMTLCMVVLMLPIHASAASGGSIIDVSDSTTTSGDGWTYSGGVFTVTGDVTITGTSTTNRVVVQSGVTADIILDNADIQTAVNDTSSFKMTGATVNLTLVGSSTLKGGTYSAGLQVPAGAALIIGGTGSLTATGRDCGYRDIDGGAGIGGNVNEHCGDITIISGNITAIGGSEAAGIGGGSGFGVPSLGGGNITITGGTIHAVGGNNAAGIGAGFGRSSGNIVITGGTVTATGGNSSTQLDGAGAGIGGGGGIAIDRISGASGRITIVAPPASVSATGGSSTETCGGAAIGSGGNGDFPGAPSGAAGDAANPITITGGSGSVTVTPGTSSMGRNGAPIGSGGSDNGPGTAILPSSTLTTHTITASADVDGSITPSGSVSVIEGANQVFTVTANPGYLVDTVTVDGTPMTVNKYSFTFAVPNVTAAHTVTATFKEDNAETPAITTQPAGRTYTRNAAAVPITVAASVTDGGTLSYQWYQNSINSNTGGTAIPGATTASYSPNTTALGTTYYYCVVTNTNTAVTGTQTADITSNAAAITVNAGGTTPPPTPTSYAVTFDTNGGSAVTGQTVTKDGKLTKPADPKKDKYTFTGWYTDKACTKAYNFNSGVTSAFTLYAGWKWANPFTDVKTSDWFYGDVEYVYLNDLFEGTGANTFSPGVSTTRGMLATLLWRMEGKPEPKGTNPFTDLKADWAKKAIIWANEQGIVQGHGGGIFGEADAVTREQMATMLYRYAQFKGYDISKSADIGKYEDSGAISSYALTALQWANAEGLVNGRSATLLAPQGTASRAEIAAVLHRFCVTFDQ